MTDRKQPGVAFWATVVVVVVILYPLAYGPWWYARGKWGGNSRVVRMSRYLFVPVEFAGRSCPELLTEPYARYCLWCYDHGAYKD